MYDATPSTGRWNTGDGHDRAGLALGQRDEAGRREESRARSVQSA